jgi:ketosteroid isomerase-like protein
MNKQLIISLLVFCACTAQSNRSKDLKQLQQLHEQQKKAHLEKRVALLTEMFAPDFINIDSGNIDRPTKEQSRKRFQSYFDQVEFIAWKDIEDPIIRISKDGTMAYVIVHKFVHLKIPQPDGKTVESKTTFAWMEAWEKISGDWKMKAIASTESEFKS